MFESTSTTTMTATENNINLSDSDIQHYIQAQARVAFGKANRNSGVEVEDYVAIGYMTLEKARKTYKEGQGTKFNTYFTMLLQRDLYHEIAKSHRKSRGGAGNKAEECSHKRYSEEKKAAAKERWESGEAEKEIVHQVSIDETVGDDDSLKIQFPAKNDDSVDFSLLVEQVGKYIPKSSLPVFKQLIDPDETLCKMACERYKDRKEVTIDNKLLAEYLNMPVGDLKLHVMRVQTIVANRLGVKI